MIKKPEVVTERRRARVVRWLRASWPTDKYQRWLATVMLVVVAAGLFLRSRGMFDSSIPLWEDEAFWALRLNKGEYLFRPIGFMLATHGLTALFGWGEVTLRLLPWLAGLGVCVLSIPFARRAFTTATAQLLFVAALNLHPVAIDFSKEFKPYSIALFVHFACMFLALEYQASKARAWLWCTLVVSLVAPFFSQDVVFAYPGVFLVLGYSAWRAQKRRDFAIVGLTAVATLLTLLALYYFSWRGLAVDLEAADDANMWASKYNVFFQKHGAHESRLSWILGRYGEVASFPGAWRDGWSAIELPGPLKPAVIKSTLLALWLVLNVLGLASLLGRRRGTGLLLWVLPILVLVAFNAFGFWPFGAFRTNLFLLPYALALACSALDHPLAAAVPAAEGAAKRRRMLQATLPALLIVGLPLLLFERGWHRNKESLQYTLPSEVLQATQAIADLQGVDFKGSAEPLLVDHSFCSSLRYYRRLHPNHKAFDANLRARVKPRCVTDAQAALRKARRLLAAGNRRVWLMTGSLDTLATEQRDAPSGFVVTARWERAPVALVLALRRAKARKAAKILRP